MKKLNQPVAVEGYPFIGLFAFVTLLFAVLGWLLLFIPGLALTLFSIYFFRNPDRYPPKGENLVLAPADGKVVFAGRIREERFFEGQEVFKVSVFMNVFNVHVNRSPLTGKVVDTFYNRGRFINASLDKASLENEQAGMLIELPDSRRVMCVQIAGLIARRIISYPDIGDFVERGSCYGLIRFGSRVDIYLPEDTALQVTLGDRTVAGETVLGVLS